MARFVDLKMRAAFEADGVSLHLRRLAFGFGDTAGRVEVFQAPKPHHMGARKRPRGEAQLEEYG